jgi:hypothetical protein
VSITEGRRHDLHEGLAEAIGRERAETLMSMLPPVGWADVATKQDLQILRSELRADLAELRSDVERGLRQQLWGMLVGLWVTVVSAIILNAILT